MAASAPSSVACLSSSPKGAAAAGGFLDKGRLRSTAPGRTALLARLRSTAPDRTALLLRLRESGASKPSEDDEGRRGTAQDRASFRVREAGASQFSNDESPTVPPAASLTTTQIANTLRGYARRQERPVVALQALAAELPRRSNWPSNPSPTLTLARPQP